MSVRKKENVCVRERRVCEGEGICEREREREYMCVRERERETEGIYVVCM